MENQVRNNLKDQNELIDNQFKRECRQKALSSSERLNPVQTFINQQIGGLNDGKSKPTIVQVLADADQIYNWLIKDL